MKLRLNPTDGQALLRPRCLCSAQRVEVMQDAQGWAQVRLSSGQVGWRMMTKFLAFEGAEDVPESDRTSHHETFEVEVLD